MTIAALMLTGEAFYAGRAKASHETWLQDFDAYQIHSYAPCDFLPITRVGNVEGKLSCYNKRHEGMQAAWKDHSAMDWFLFCSCDAYFWIDNLRKALTWAEEQKPNHAILVGGPHFHKRLTDGTELLFPAGGGGYCLNRAAMRSVVENLPMLRSRWPKFGPNCQAEDVFIGWAARQLRIPYLEHHGFHQANPLSGTWPYQTPREQAVSYHYLSAEDILAIRDGKK